MLDPFMGIKDWDKVGLSVAESAERLRHIAYFDRKIMRIAAGRMIACPEYEIKGILARVSWLDAVHHDQLRGRCKQLRMGSSAFDKSPGPVLDALMNAVLDSPGTLELLSALFEVIKPAQIEAISRYMEAAQPIVDQPTLHILRHQLLDREDEIAWGREAIAHLSSSAGKDELDFLQQRNVYLARLLAAGGGADGTGPAAEMPDSDEFLTDPFVLPDHSPRDSRYTSSVTKFKDIHFEDSDEGRFKMMMYSRYFEMSPAEGVAYVLFETTGRPWAFYLDTARHLWDEVRHSWFGEAALRKLGYDVYEAPNWIGFYEVSKNLFGPEEAYVHLTVAIEQAAMKYPPGKREEWEFARDTAKDPLMTTFQDFDWADEVVHAGFGKKWVVDTAYEGNVEAARKDADLTWERRNRFMGQAPDRKIIPQSPFAGNY
ncbi:hypothetical protein [Paenibacillus nasutitermitis]|uniref:DUF455 family protein n=1 Tax=Paenibacillus nasutitermitis TaxID=1652958 RepID=A0A916YR25_9BACL|nr:hypothetical protein [Paenibacillus nasutitermitis]GGD56717.1 hypothetical protein GCM10010911_13050 [Paenibacillus nasutitermitis]